MIPAIRAEVIQKVGKNNKMYGTGSAGNYSTIRQRHLSVCFERFERLFMFDLNIIKGDLCHVISLL